MSNKEALHAGQGEHEQDEIDDFVDDHTDQIDHSDHSNNFVLLLMYDVPHHCIDWVSIFTEEQFFVQN